MFERRRLRGAGGTDVAESSNGLPAASFGGFPQSEPHVRVWTFVNWLIISIIKFVLLLFCFIKLYFIIIYILLFLSKLNLNSY